LAGILKELAVSGSAGQDSDGLGAAGDIVGAKGAVREAADNLPSIEPGNVLSTPLGADIRRVEEDEPNCALRQGNLPKILSGCRFCQPF
jgi:hypothetical protein